MDGDEATNAYLGNYEDCDLPKAIYFAVAFSPFSLLTAQRMNVDNSSDRLPLSSITAVRRHTYAKFLDALAWEKRLFETIKRMTIEGCDIFDACMVDIACNWRWDDVADDAYDEQDGELDFDSPDSIKDRGLFAWMLGDAFLKGFVDSRLEIATKMREDPKRFIAEHISEMDTEIRENDLRFGIDLVVDREGEEDEEAAEEETGEAGQNDEQEDELEEDELDLLLEKQQQQQ